MLTVKIKFKLELVSKNADAALESWLIAEDAQKLKEYFIECLADKLKTDGHGGVDVLEAKAEWRPDNNE